MARLTQLPGRPTLGPSRIIYTKDQAKGPAPHRDNAPWRKNYKTTRWRQLRVSIFRRDLYTCQMCGRIEGDTSKLVCDHKRPHRGDERLFWRETNLQTLCKSPCHDKHKQTLEQESRRHVGVWD